VTPVRILVADDHEVVRRGVRAVLEGQAGWVVCGEARSGREAVALAVALQPDVVVLDITMPELNGLDATRQLRRLVQAKVLILTVHESDQVVSDVLDAGAHGYVVKTDAGRTLVEAIRALLDHHTFVSKGAHGSRERRPRARGAKSVPGAPGPLTPREREVVQLLAEGKSNKEIGVVLGITAKTAETHRAHVMAKLELHSMSELVRYAIRNRIIEA
jgi:DNA-binding NarL/FixJ family response regulator